MADYDYIKVLDIIAKTLNADKFDVVASHDKFDKYEAEITCDDGSVKKCSLNITGKYQMDLSMSVKSFTGGEFFEKWLDKFEFHLEQAFKVNIKIKWEIDAGEYRIKILF